MPPTPSKPTTSPVATFKVWASRPSAGRLIQADDDVAGAMPVVVLGELFSRRRFGDARAAIGQTIRINDKPFDVVGVAPSNFFGAEPGATPDLFMAIHALPVVETGTSRGRVHRRALFLGRADGTPEARRRIRAGPGGSWRAVSTICGEHRHHPAAASGYSRAQPPAGRDRPRQPSPRIRAADLRADGDGRSDSAHRLLRTSPIFCSRARRPAAAKSPSGSASAPAAGA